MINIYALICDTLQPLGYPVQEQGTYAPNERLPETFVTYQIIDQSSYSHADNAPTSQTDRVQVVLYSRDPSLKQSANEAFMGVMLPAGFMRVSGRDLPYASSTGHYAYTSDYRYYDSID